MKCKRSEKCSPLMPGRSVFFFLSSFFFKMAALYNEKTTVTKLPSSSHAPIMIKAWGKGEVSV